MTKSDPDRYLPTSVQKSYFMLSRSTRAVLDMALRKYRPGRTDLMPVGGIAQLKPALELMTEYRLVIQDINGAEVLTSYTRWLECVQVKEGPEQEVYVAFSPRFERIWLESRKRLPDMDQKPGNAGLRSQYSLRLYGWAKKHVQDGAQTISLEELRRVFGLESKVPSLILFSIHSGTVSFEKGEIVRHLGSEGALHFSNRSTGMRPANTTNCVEPTPEPNI